MKFLAFVTVAVAAVTIFSGCSHSTESDDEPPVKLAQVTFTGKVDPTFVGNWKTSDGVTEIDMSTDGGLVLVSTTPGHPGPPTKQSGKWLVNDGKLLLQYGSADGAQQTLSYAAKVAAKKLTLTTSVPKRDTVYNRI